MSRRILLRSIDGALAIAGTMDQLRAKLGVEQLPSELWSDRGQRFTLERIEPRYIIYRACIITPALPEGPEQPA